MHGRAEKSSWPLLAVLHQHGQDMYEEGVTNWPSLCQLRIRHGPRPSRLWHRQGVVLYAVQQHTFDAATLAIK